MFEAWMSFAGSFSALKGVIFSSTGPSRRLKDDEYQHAKRLGCIAACESLYRMFGFEAAEAGTESYDQKRLYDAGTVS